MERKRNWVVWGACALAGALLLAMAGLYLFNPLGVDSWDPRERTLGYGIYRIPTAAMSPSIEAGQVVFANVGYHDQHAPERGEIVVLRVPGQEIRVIKRIVGLPGETVAMRRGAIEIDGKRLSEPYVATASATTPYSREMPPFTIPPNAYFVLGDNRDNSEDSRTWGAIDRKYLQARILAR